MSDCGLIAVKAQHESAQKLPRNNLVTPAAKRHNEEFYLYIRMEVILSACPFKYLLNLIAYTINKVQIVSLLPRCQKILR